MHSSDSLLQFRQEINNIDKKIIDLLAKRKLFILKIAHYKIKNNQNIRDLTREKELLQKVIILGKENHLNSHYITRLFQLIIEESVLTQQILLQKFYTKNKLNEDCFSFLGPKGSYSQIALHQYVNRYDIKYHEKECETFEDVVCSVNKNKSNYAILPIKNNSSGIIKETFNILKKTNLFIIGEISITINHCLLTVNQTKLNQIKKIYSHSQPFKQCSHFINQFSNWKIKYTKSTADAMKKVAQYNDKSNAALGSAIGGQLYKLNILASNLANQEKNITKFIILSKYKINVSHQISSKTSILFMIKHRSNDLSKILEILQKNSLIIRYSLLKNIDDDSSEEILYIDIYENISSKKIKKTIQQIDNLNINKKILGCYPAENITPVAP